MTTEVKMFLSKWNRKAKEYGLVREIEVPAILKKLLSANPSIFDDEDFAPLFVEAAKLNILDFFSVHRFDNEKFCWMEKSYYCVKENGKKTLTVAFPAIPEIEVKY